MREMDGLSLLIKGGMSPRRAHRVMREFKDHRADIVEERLSLGESLTQARAAADLRLGSFDSLAVRMLMRPELKSFAHRWPWTSWVLLPLLGHMLLFVLVAALLIWAFDLTVHVLPAAQLALILWPALLIGVPALSALLLVRTWVGRQEDARRPVIGLALVCFFGAISTFSFVDRVGSQPGEISIGLGLDSATMADVALRTLLSLGLAALYWCRLKRSVPEER